MNQPELDLPALQRVSVTLSAALLAINEDQWALPTPCSEWNLQALVDHVAGGNWYTCHILDGAGSEEALEMTMRRFADGSVSVTDAVQSVAEQLAAFTNPATLEQTWQHVAGALAGSQILRLRLHDLIVHTWDIDETTASPASVPTDLAEWGLAELQNADSLMAQHFAIPDQPNIETTDTDASARYLRSFGRLRPSSA